MPLNWKPSAVKLSGVCRVGVVAGWGDHMTSAKLFQSMPVAASSARFASSSSNPCAEPTGPANAAICQPRSSAPMTVSTNNIVRLLTTVSPTHLPTLLISLGSCDAEADACGTVEPTYWSGLLNRSSCFLYSLSFPFTAIYRKRIAYWRLRVIECLQGSGLSCLGA